MQIVYGENMAVTIHKDWKFYTGITFLILSLIFPLFGFFVPLLDLPTPIEVAIITALTVGGPELMIMFAAAFLGKETYIYIKGKVRAFFRRKKKSKSVGMTRYYIGLFIFLMSPTLLYFNAYWPEIMPQDATARYYLLVSGDLAFVLSFFIMGASFWEKFKRLFIWNV